MELTNMTNRNHIDGIPATADATMMHILTHGFSSSRGNRRNSFSVIAGGTIKRLGRTGRTENGYWHKDDADMSADHIRRQAATKRADDALLAAEIRDLFTVKALGRRSVTTIDKNALNASVVGVQTRRAKRQRVMREVEVVHVKTVNGARRVVKREVQQVECKRARQH
jgi:hypothetical protein